MALSPNELRDLQAALRPLAPTLAGDVSGPRADRAVDLLSLSVLSKPSTGSASAAELLTAVGSPENSEKVRSTEAFWVANQPPNAPGAAAPVVARNGREQSRIDDAKLTSRVARHLAYITTLGFFLLVFALIALDRIFPAHIAGGATASGSTSGDSSYRDILMTLMGVIGTGWAGIISFYFGSSVGSRAQSDTLQDISKRVTDQPGGATGGTPPTAQRQP